MPLSKLQFRPGINTEITSYSNEGGWIDCDKVRFRFGFPEKIGGWTRFSNRSFLGSCRSLFSWTLLSGDKYIGVGTSKKFYIATASDYYDITPIRETTAAGDVTFSATDGSSTLTVTDNTHGAVAGDFVTLSGAASLGGNITADVLNQEYEILTVPTVNTYTIQARTAGTSIASITVDGQLVPEAVTANSSDTGNGGASVVGEYQINVGLDQSVSGTGWGVGNWSRGAWGSGTTSSVFQQLRLWSQDNFGEDLVFNLNNGAIYYWDASGGVNTRAVVLSSLSGATSTPTVARQVLISDRDRHILAFGCDTESNPGVQDPLAIRFSDQESLTDWATTAANTAGELRLGSGSKIIAAVETRQQILVFTDTTLYTLQFLGPPFTFGVSGVSENITISGLNAAVAVDDSVYWMGEEEFYVYKGAVQRIPCTVRDHVFNDFNTYQKEKVTSGVNSSYGEIWWFYPSASSQTNNKYVVYNYLENTWYYGSLPRTAWIDHGVYEYPLAASSDGYIYQQENGFDDGSTTPISAISSFITSAPIDIGDGESFAFIKRLFPDVTFRDSSESSPTFNITTRVRNKSSGAFLKETTSSITSTTELVNLRLRGRQFSINLGTDTTGTTWRLGTMRYDIRPDGRR